MSVRIIVSLLLLAAVLVGAYFLFFIVKKGHITNYPSKGTDIIAFGDSLIVGYGSSEGNDFVSLISKDFNRPISNLGVSGDTTADGVARLNQLDKYNPKVVILLFGGNDALRKIPKEQTFENVEKIIVDIQKRGSIVLLLGVRGGPLGDPYAAQYKFLADKYKTAYVSDVLSGLFGNKKYMHDAVHPNDAGYAKIADRIEPILLGLLQ